MQLLLHTCCAPCSLKCIQSLQEEGIEPTLFWFNPNIQPYTEFKMRKNTLVQFAKDANLQLVIDKSYDVKAFVDAVYKDFANRCRYCYQMRMEAVAKYAVQNGYQSFSSTLFISPYQNHELMRAEAQAAAEKHGSAFLYRDFRPLFREGQAAARESGLYMQKYCGCIFSEQERYLKS